MTPSEAAEGRRLLAAHLERPATDAQLELDFWLWANREELVRCAELAAERPAPTETAHGVCFYGEPACGLCVRCRPPRTGLDPRLAHALANPPGPRGARLAEVEPQAAPTCGHTHITNRDGWMRCNGCGASGAALQYVRKGAPQKPEGEA